MPTAVRPQSPIPGHAYIHGVYMYDKQKNTSAIVANVKNLETGDSQLHICKDPKYPFWVTKPGLRTHKEKKESAPLSELDKYIYPYHEFPYAITRALGGYPRGYIGLKDVCDSPYVYGADISPTVMLKHQYRKACQNKLPMTYNVGALDIESSVLGNNEVIACSYADGKTHVVYCSVYAPFMKGATVEDLHTIYNKESSEIFKQVVNKLAKASIEKTPYTAVFYIADKEEDVIRWCIAQMHRCKPDFCAVWNMDYDIPQMAARLKFRGIDPAEVFCHPDVPKEFRFFKHIKGKVRKGQHITDAWPWLHCSGYTQFFDAMCLYGRLRKALERESKYTLDFILRKTVGIGKLDFGQYSTHYEMQTHAFPRYCVYCDFDSIGTELHGEATTDVFNMMNLIAGSDLCDFDKQTVQLKNKFYEYCLNKGHVPASVGNSLLKDYDRMITNVGGGVLDPKYSRNVGVPILEEEERETNMLVYVSDIDVGSSYPMNQASRNISRETKLASVLALKDRPFSDINKIFEMVIDVDENSVKLMSTFFGLPDFHTVHAKLDAYMQTH